MEALQRSENRTSEESHSAAAQRNYVVNVEDLSVTATTTSKENAVPSFNTSRGQKATKAAELLGGGKETSKLAGPANGAGGGAGKHNKFMAKYGLLKYGNLFKPV